MTWLGKFWAQRSAVGARVKHNVVAGPVIPSWFRQCDCSSRNIDCHARSVHKLDRVGVPLHILAVSHSNNTVWFFLSFGCLLLRGAVKCKQQRVQGLERDIARSIRRRRNNDAERSDLRPPDRPRQNLTTEPPHKYLFWNGVSEVDSVFMSVVTCVLVFSPCFPHIPVIFLI